MEYWYVRLEDRVRLEQSAVIRLLLVLGAASVTGPSALAGTLFIVPTIDSSATAYTGAITAAINTIESLYATPTAVSLTIPITFTTATTGSFLLETSQSDNIISYSSYKTALVADAALNPTNITLATAIAHLADGNDANGADNIALSDSLFQMLIGGASSSGATITINTSQPFGLTQPVTGSEYDLTGALEHELDEVLGAGGAGSTLNALADDGTPCTSGRFPAFCNTFGPLDLYRYLTGTTTPSFSDVSNGSMGAGIASLSINGGVTDIVGLNQDTAGDLADFGPECQTASGGGELIQNAFNCMGPDEAYTTSSPEFTMEQSIGWDANPTAAGGVPEPATFVLVGTALIGAAALRRRSISRKNKTL
jgi:PEP-CTERM motif